MRKNTIVVGHPKWDDIPIEGNPRFPYLMHYMSWILDSVVEEIRKEGLDVTDLRGDECNRDNLKRVLEDGKPILYIHGAHGACNALSTQDMKIIICSPKKGFCESEDISWDASIGCESPNQEWFKGMICYNIACLSGRWLAPDKVDQGAVAVLAYNDSLGMNIGTNPDAYWIEEVFREAFSSGIKALLAGKKSGEAKVEMEKEYGRMISEVRQDHPREAFYIVPILVEDRDRLVLVGSEEAKVKGR